MTYVTTGFGDVKQLLSGCTQLLDLHYMEYSNLEAIGLVRFDVHITRDPTIVACSIQPLPRDSDEAIEASG